MGEKKRFAEKCRTQCRSGFTEKIITEANNLGVKYITVYAFSTENWKRPGSEVNYLMRLPVDFFNDFMPDLIKENVKVEVMGELDDLPPQTRQASEKAMADTANNTGMILNFALNYGGRDELVHAAQKLAKQVQEGELSPDDIDDRHFANALMTGFLGDLADPDLLIRTSGELRISNFLLWQIAYSELVFVDDYWPDFSPAALEAAIAEYQARDRRFGGLKNKQLFFGNGGFITMKQRVITAVVALAIFIPILIAGGGWIDIAGAV